MNIKERISALRAQMSNNNCDAVLFLTGDPHQNEYLPDFYKSRAWISGFTGSAGTVVITKDHAGLWTDARYFLQADQQLADSGVELHKLQVQGAPEYGTWLVENLPTGASVCVDGNTISIGAAEELRSIFDPKKINLELEQDPVADIWTDRVGQGAEPIFEHPEGVAGLSRVTKIMKLRAEMKSLDVDYYLVTALDDTGWLLNLRGSDIACNPVFLSYTLITPTEVILFVDYSRIPSELIKSLQGDGISMLPYNSISEHLLSLPKEAHILVNPGSLSANLANSLAHTHILKGASPIMVAKSIKNEIEQAWIRKVMVKDGIALTRFFKWLENELAHGHEMTEYDLTFELIRFRKQQPGYVGESFDAIIGYKGNGAIIHYKPEQETAATIRPTGVLLVDSGGQYIDGTTDTTRTITLGDPTEEERLAYTLVLQGHIGVATAVFPQGTKGIQLDTLARLPLWKRGMNYLHGTGHGVGFFMNVHEPPQGIVNTLAERGVTLHRPGQLTSNEPGFYKKDAFGIRIENLILCNEAMETEYGHFYNFETVTLCYIDKSLIIKDLLSKEEIQWLDLYHEQVLAKLSIGLNQEEISWLRDKCNPL
ncbi:MAG TPA: aminopeptidase P family protein [Saprospiraceae bacterium]|nr:aminopeptidase P family protein [Saprospiraceae bacterium]